MPFTDVVKVKFDVKYLNLVVTVRDNTDDKNQPSYYVFFHNIPVTPPK